MIEQLRCKLSGGHDYDVMHYDENGYKFRIRTCVECGTTKINVLP